MFWLIDFLIVTPITNILFVIYNFVGDFGLAIIIFTVLVKLLSWPLTKSQLHQTKLMRSLQPKLAEIKKNCNGNREMESLQTLDLYKKYNVKPFRSILTLFIQFPIFIALFAGISSIANPRPSGNTCGYTNVANCAYAPVRSLTRVQEVIDLQEPYLAAAETPAEEGNTEKPTYDFKPRLFGVVDLSAKAGFTSVTSLVILLFAVLAAFCQFYQTRQQLPSGKQKSRKFRDLLKDTAAGAEPSQEDINAMVTKQMSLTMPLMMFLIMINLPGALVFYYLLSSSFTIFQQRLVFHAAFDDMDNLADKKILRELKGIQEAEVIENKKTGTRITRISARDAKKSGKSK